MENKLIPYEATSTFGMGRILVFAPHPDDEVFGCGGAILRQVAEGGAIKVIVVTGGDFHPNGGDTQLYAAARREESQRAARVLGYGAPDFWDLPDRSLEYCETLVSRIEAAIDAFAPDGLFAPSVYEMHPDHRALGMAALEAVRRSHCALKLVMYEVGVPMPRPNLLLDITDLMDAKQAAMACFVSQLQGQAYDQHIGALNRFRTYTLGPQVHAAEAYRIAQPSELDNGSLELYESEYQRQRSLGLPMMPQDIPLVSVIVRNPGHHPLRRALDSIALQTYANIEVIVTTADSGGQLPLKQACGRFPLTEVPIDGVRTLAVNANFAMQRARGKYLVFLDADNHLLPDHVAKLTNAIGDCKALASYADANGEPWDAERLMGAGSMPISAILFERSLFEQGCSFRDGLGGGTDRDFWLQISQHTPIEHISNVTNVAAARRNERTEASDRHTQELADLKERLHSVNQEFDELAQVLARQVAHIDALNNRVQAMVHSTSWKITGPLRFLVSLLRGQGREG